MRNEAVAVVGDDTPLAPLRRYLGDRNEVLRSAAIKALSAVLDDPAALRAVLIDALLDPDPDVRSDAMEVLARVARPEDADTIRRSLEGDPVREVKLAAVGALARLGDRASVDLLRALVSSRSEDRIAWEDEAGDWEDWLDVQVAAIAALGEMGIAEAIEDLLAARKDEFGQTLDVQVFEALGRIGSEGVDRLLAVVGTEGGLARQRAADALARVSPETLASHVDTLLASDDPSLRGLALKALAPDDPRARERAMKDPDAGVRLAGLRQVAPLYPDLALQALSDREPAVQAAALDHLRPPLVPEVQDALVDNMLAWLDTAAPVLMTAAARHLPALAPNRSERPLLALIADGGRPLEARVAAVTALGSARPAIATEAFADLLANPARQVRTAALVVLRARARSGDPIAVDVVAEAIAGRLLSGEAAEPVPGDDEDGPDLSAPKGEGAGASPIRITPEGEIVEMDPATPVEGAGKSTLSTILSGSSVSEAAMAEDTPEETSAKRRKRRPVEGSHDVAETLSCDAMQACADLGLERVEAAILTRALDVSGPVRRAAWQALMDHCGASQVGDEARAAARRAFEDDDPVVRLATFTLLSRQDAEPDLVAAAERDADALLRAAAVALLPPETALAHLADDALAVRCAAAERVLACGSDALVASAVDCLVAAERADTLALVSAASEAAVARALWELSRNALPPRKALVLLNAFAELRGETA